MRQKIVAGNWKMNKNQLETLALAQDLVEKENTSGARVLIFPSYVTIATAKEALSTSKIEVGAQNMSGFVSGAYTGEVSAEMLKSIGVKTILLGHSERRSLFGETPEIIAQKVKLALESGIEVIFCCGEILEHRKSGAHFTEVQTQLEQSVFDLSAEDFSKIVIAYEPVWAIGTGETATSDQAQEMHAFIRSIIAKKYNESIAENTSILYGGSCKPTNAKEIFSMPDVDGGLIGGASLKADDFFAIVNANV